MDFFDTLKILIRRWKILVPMLLLTMVATVGAYNAAASQYKAQNSLLLVVPPAPPGTLLPDGQKASVCDKNPFCGSGNLTNLGNVVAQSMLDETRSAAILNGHPGASYTVLLSTDDRSPIVIITATGTSAVDTLATLKSATNAVTAELARRQREIGVPSDSLIDSDPVVVARTATVQSGGKTRAAAAVLAVGVLLSLGSALLAENIARSKARRRKAGQAATNPAVPMTPAAAAAAVDWGDIDTALRRDPAPPGNGKGAGKPAPQPAGRAGSAATADAPVDEPQQPSRFGRLTS